LIVARAFVVVMSPIDVTILPQTDATKISMSRHKPGRIAVSRREDAFVDRPVTRIWREQATVENPYVAEKCACHGYDVLELANKRSYIDVLFLLFRGELPTAEQEQLLQRLMIAFINPGPRHPATRAAMNAGVSRTDVGHILPIALSLLSASGIEDGMRFLRKNQRRAAEEVAAELYTGENNKPEEGDWLIAPGFGSSYDSIDSMAQHTADVLLETTCNKPVLEWGNTFARALNDYGMGWLPSGIVAAVLADLGFQPRAGIGLFQILCAPGLLAHGAEMANKPLTAMPFIADENYVIET
jgi:citrate synthase